MESSHFDDSIKKALEQFKAEGVDNWERMQSLLNDSANADLSERAEDHVLRNKLEEVTPDMPVGHWAILDAQLANIEGEGELEDVLLDGKAYESLNDYNAPYNAAHWPIMEEKIESSFSWRKRAVRYKVAELAILLLTFVTILQYFPEAKKILPKLKKEKPTLSAPIAALPESNLIEEEALAVAPAPIVSVETTIEDATNNSNAFVAINHIDDFVSSIKRADSFDLFKDMVNNKSKKKTNNSPLVPSPLSIHEHTQDLQSIDNIQSKAVEALPIIDFRTAGPIALSELPKFGVVTGTPKFSKSGFRIGMYVLGSYDAVDNNPDKIDLLTRAASTPGYGTGLSLGFKTGRWELESGLGYLSKTVRPTNLVGEDLVVSLALREFSETVWTEAHYDIIDIPVQIKFDFLQRSRWKAYVKSGVSMNINQNVIYRYDQVINGSVASEFEIQAYGISRAEAEDEKGKLNTGTQLPKNVGTSEEALQFQSNASFSVNVGFGLERAINRRYAAFVQTQYVHQLSLGRNLGIEDESSIFRSPQLRLGVKATIFK